MDLVTKYIWHFVKSPVLKIQDETWSRESKNEWKEEKAWCQLSDLKPAEADLWEVTATALPVRIPPVIGSERVEHSQTRAIPPFPLVLSYGPAEQNTASWQPWAQKAPFCLQPTSIECNLLFSVYFPQELLYITHEMTSFHFVEPHEVWELFAAPPTTSHTQKAPRHKSRREEMKMITLLLPNVANGRI